METFILTLIFIFGLFFGSFASVIITRLKHEKSGIVSGRSECPKCKHQLSAFDLLPFFSWIFSAGKCRYCKSKISIFYPVLELSMGTLFFLSSYFLVDISQVLLGSGFEIFKLFSFLFISFFIIIFIFYDILYLEINDIILGILVGFTFILITLQTVIQDFIIFDTLVGYTALSSYDFLLVIAGSILILGLMYYIIFGGADNIVDLGAILFIFVLLFIFIFVLNMNISEIALLSGIFGAFFIFFFFYLQIIISGGRWLGGGDLRIAIFMGLILGVSYSFMGLLITYTFGSCIGIFILFISKFKKSNKDKQLLTNSKKIINTILIPISFFVSKSKKINTFSKGLFYFGIGAINVFINKFSIKEEEENLNQIPFGPFLAFGLIITMFFHTEIMDLYNNNFILSLY